MRDHGGNLDRAMADHGGGPGDWIDLSTGINRQPYPLPALPPAAWTALPTGAATEALIAAARTAYGTTAAILPVAGAQAAIQMIPRAGSPARARVLAPSYNEHAASLRAAGWAVEEVSDAAELAGADLAVVVNPNNPDGRTHRPGALLTLAGRVGRLIVDESFADPVPEFALAPAAGVRGLLILRSFGKFYGLAGLRLGFVIGHPDDLAPLAEMAGPWPVSGVAIAVGTSALADRSWAEATAARLRGETGRLDRMAARTGWRLVGGCDLFRTYETAGAAAAQDRLARAHIWSRMFPHSPTWLRLGLPGTEEEWRRLEGALA
jgi:cobalamin biosynthetic protein CobC